PWWASMALMGSMSCTSTMGTTPLPKVPQHTDWILIPIVPTPLFLTMILTVIWTCTYSTMPCTPKTPLESLIYGLNGGMKQATNCFATTTANLRMLVKKPESMVV